MNTNHVYLPAIAIAVCVCFNADAAETVSHHENVLGTSLELHVDAPSQETATDVERTSLATIDRLARILSRYDADSEVSRWQRGELNGKPLSTELAEVLQAAERWRERTDGAFDIRAGVFTKLWSQAADKQTLLDAAQRRTLIAQLTKPTDVLVPDGNLPVSLDALAKGYILDAVCETVQKRFKDVHNFTINIGGDICKFGPNPLRISITHPASAEVGSAPLLTFPSNGSLAIATSGGYRRHFDIQGRKFSHIIDPRTGFPQNFVLSASVIAPTAMAADAAATALCVLGPEEGLPLIQSLDGFECLVLSADGKLSASAGWPTSQTATNTPLVQESRDPERTYFTTSTAAASKTGLLVNFKLNRPKGGRYRRPYVAVWLEDKDGFPVKTAVLWMQTDSPGPRWHRDLTRWYRNDRMRQVVEKKKLIGTISGATRGPGEYKARFDGTDNDGRILPPGKYTLCIEAAREHGTYQIIRKSLELSDKPIKQQSLKNNVEVSKATYSYTPWTAEKENAVQ